MPYKDKEVLKKYKAAWHQANKERLRPKSKINRKVYEKRHPDKIRAKAKRHYIKHKDKMNEKNREYWVKYGRYRFYGVEPEEFDTMYSEQEGKCRICSIDIPLRGRETHIDHDHVTGKIRGLLCRSCNLGLGFFKDNIELMEKAVEYLKEKK